MEYLNLITEKHLFAITAIVISLIGNGVYISSILRDETKPHLFTFIVWALVMGLIFFTQLTEGAGLAAWVTALNAVFCLIIAALAFTKRTDIVISRSDWGFFLAALAAIPVWLTTSNPLWAVIMLTTIDMMAFLPTIRKSYVHPFEENLFGHSMFALQNVLILVAIENMTLTTAFYPLTMVATVSGFLLIVSLRRKSEQRANSQFAFVRINNRN